MIQQPDESESAETGQSPAHRLRGQTQAGGGAGDQRGGGARSPPGRAAKG